MIVRVRSTAIARPLSVGSAPQHARDGRADVGGTLDGRDAGGVHRAPSLGGGALDARDGGARVAHASGRGRRLAADEANHRFSDVALHEGCGLFLRGPQFSPISMTAWVAGSAWHRRRTWKKIVPF